MAVGQSTFSGASAAVSDLFAGLGTLAQGELKGTGLNIQAQGVRLGAESTRISAEGTRLTAEGMRIKARGDIAEADNYDLASAFARQNEQYTAASTNIKESQLSRQIMHTIGGQRADVAGSGLAQTGSAMSLLSDSAAQGALARHVLVNQGQITEAGYEQQAKSYDTMSAAGRAAAAAEMDIADRTDVLASRTDKIAAGQDEIAARTDDLAQQTIQASKDAATGSFISSAIKAAGVVAGVVLAPATGGLSLGLTAAALSSSGSAAP